LFNNIVSLADYLTPEPLFKAGVSGHPRHGLSKSSKDSACWHPGTRVSSSVPLGFSDDLQLGTREPSGPCIPPAILVNLRCISTRVRAWFRCRDTAKIGKPWVVVNKPTLCRQKVRGTSCVATRLLLPRVMDLCGRLAGKPNYLVKGKGFLSVR
jgi:hypothetical protein